MTKTFSILFLAGLSLLAAAEQVYPVFFKQDPGIVIDGNLSRDDWSDIKNERKLLPGRGKEGKGRAFSFKGEKDISASVKFAYRYDGLYLGFKVTDDKHRQKCTGASAFKGDHVELLLDLQPTLAGKETKFGPKQFQLLFSPGSFDGKIKPESYMYKPVKQNLSLPVAALKTPDGYTLEAFIPWSVLGLKKQPGTQLERTIAFDILVSDTDGEAPYQEKYLFMGKLLLLCSGDGSVLLTSVIPGERSLPGSLMPEKKCWPENSGLMPIKRKLFLPLIVKILPERSLCSS